MAKNITTIEDAKKNKIKLESTILDLIKDFEKENGIYISYLSIERKYEDDDMPDPPSRRIGKLLNVEASMELDLIY